MGNFFLSDNFLVRMLTKLADCVCLSVLWSLASLPLVTVGAASSALYYTVHKCVYEEEGYLCRTFWQAFRDNWKQASLLWLIMAPIGLLLVSECYLTFQWCDADRLHPAFFAAGLGAAALMVMWLQLWFAYSARFTDTVRGVLRNTLLIAIVNFGPCFLLMLVFLSIALVVSALPEFLGMWMIFPGLFAMAVHQTAERLFAKYLPQSESAATHEEGEKE